MATPSAAYAAPSSFTFIPITKKLSQNNHQMWRAQVLSAIRGAQMAKLIKSTVQPLAPYLPPAKGDKDKKDVAPVSNPEFAI